MKGLVPVGAQERKGTLYLHHVLVSPLDYKALSLIHADPLCWRVLDHERLERLANGIPLDQWSSNMSLQYELATYMYACYARERFTPPVPLALVSLFPLERRSNQLASIVYCTYHMDTSLTSENKRAAFLMACRSFHGTSINVLPSNLVSIDQAKPRSVKEYKEWHLLQYYDTLYTNMVEYARLHSCVNGGNTLTLKEFYASFLNQCSMSELIVDSAFCTKFLWRLVSKCSNMNARPPRRVCVMRN